MTDRPGSDDDRPAHGALRRRSEPARWSAVFLDRDGTLNVKAPEGRYVCDPRDLRLLPGAAAAVRRLNDASLPVILVTNQRWLSRSGAEGARRYASVHERLVELLAAGGAWLDAAYHCPHASGSCPCRKPLPGMLIRAGHDLNIDPSAAVLVGDADSDIAAARAAGATAVLIGPRSHHCAAATVVDDVGDAVEWIVGTGLPTVP